MPAPPRSRRSYEEAFARLLEGLNPRQREAVDHLEGPVLVLAGPGTGKTHILAARIGRILLDTDAAPYNILCLTFTNAGVKAMRERLLQFIGPEAHRVHIHTFHSFCQQVIQDNLERFGQLDLQPLAELERIQLLRELIDGLDVDDPLKRGRTDAYFFLPHLQNLFSLMKREDWDPGAVEAAIDAYLADLPQREAYQYRRGNAKRGIRKGDPKTADIAEESRRMERLRAAARQFPAYEARLRARRRYDYDDMILKVLRAFERDPLLLRRYQEQYLYFLVDEFQDTNGAQYELLGQLADFWEVPNLFVVGDDDQSIYEFQGARLHNLTDFFHRYRANLRVVVLEDNYRSTQPILDAAHALIGHNRLRLVHQMGELDLRKDLLARAERPADAPRPVFRRYRNRFEEEADLLRQIEDLLAAGSPAGEIAVIYARHQQAERLMELLDKRGIPFRTRRSVDVLGLPLIDQLRTMLSVVDRETRAPGSAEAPLFRMLHFRCFGVAPADIAALSAWWRSSEELKAMPLRRALVAAVGAGGAQLAHPEALERLSACLDEWIGERYERGLPALVEEVINRSGLLGWALEQSDPAQQLGALKTFVDHVRAECRRQPRLQLGELLEQLELMEQHRLRLPLDAESLAGEGVELVTAHSAKGLEFDHVFLFDAEQRPWSDQRGHRWSFPLPDTLTYSGETDAEEARRRLFYVAATRARRRLVISCAATDADGRTLSPSPFVEELLASQRVEETSVALEPEQLLATQHLYLQQRTAPRPVRPPEATVARLLEGFSLSISALNAYLKCPLGFYYTYILGAPTTESEPALYGSAMHEALQVLFEHMMKRPERLFPPVEQLLRFFEDSMARRRAFFGTRSFERWLEMGRRDLAAYYREKHATWPRDVSVEKGLWRVEFEGVPIQGSIDRVDRLEAAAVRLVDYKTGSYHRGRDRLRRPGERHPEGGPYWRQMVFYHILFEAGDRLGRAVRETRIAYLEADPDDRRHDVAIEVRPGDTELMAKLLQTTYARIQDQQFFEGCGKDRCNWCTFVRRHAAIPARLADPELESLDDKAIT